MRYCSNLIEILMESRGHWVHKDTENAQQLPEERHQKGFLLFSSFRGIEVMKQSGEFFAWLPAFSLVYCIFSQFLACN